MWFTVLSALAAGDPPPTVQIAWKKGDSTLHVVPADGLEVAADSPADLTLQIGNRALTAAGDGNWLASGVAIGGLTGTLTGTLDLQVCEKASGICRPGSYSLTGDLPSTRKGALTLGVQPITTAPPEASPFNRDVNTAVDEAFRRATDDGTRVLLDFSAIWCPPCQALGAQVLHAPDADELLEGFEVAIVDVDHPSSWPIKDQYNVGSYPTVIVTDGEGTELDRVVGYPGKDAFLTFLADIESAGPNPETTDPTTLTPDEAARGLATLIDRHSQVDRRPWIEAMAGSETAHAHYARFVVDPTHADYEWLVDNAAERVPFAIGAQLDWARGEGRKAVLESAPTVQTRLSGEPAVDLLYYLGEIQEGPAAEQSYAAGAVLLRAQIAADPSIEHSATSFLTMLLKGAGEIDQAIALLDRLTRDNPADPSFPLDAAYLLEGDGAWEQALARAELARARGWGDIVLRAATVQGRALIELDRTSDAKRAIQTALDAQPAPAEALVVRSHRYRQRLTALLDEL